MLTLSGNLNIALTYFLKHDWDRWLTGILACDNPYIPRQVGQIAAGKLTYGNPGNQPEHVAPGGGIGFDGEHLQCLKQSRRRVYDTWRNPFPQFGYAYRCGN